MTATAMMMTTTPAPTPEYFEIIDSAELAKRWALPESWIRDQVRSRAVDPLPCLRFGKYVRFQWGSEPLEAWLARRRMNGKR